MDFMHHVLGDDMEGAYLIAMFLGIAAGAAARLSRVLPPEGDRFRVLRHHDLSVVLNLVSKIFSILETPYDGTIRPSP